MSSLVEIEPMDLRKKFLDFVNAFFAIGKRRGPSFEQIWNPFTQGCFVLSLNEISAVIVENIF